MSTTQEQVSPPTPMMEMHWKQLKELFFELEFEASNQTLRVRGEDLIREWKELYSFLAQLERDRRGPILSVFDWEVRMLIARCRIKAGVA